MYNELEIELEKEQEKNTRLENMLTYLWRQLNDKADGRIVSPSQENILKNKTHSQVFALQEKVVDLTLELVEKKAVIDIKDDELVKQVAKNKELEEKLKANEQTLQAARRELQEVSNQNKSQRFALEKLKQEKTVLTTKLEKKTEKIINQNSSIQKLENNLKVSKHQKIEAIKAETKTKKKLNETRTVMQEANQRHEANLRAQNLLIQEKDQQLEQKNSLLQDYAALIEQLRQDSLVQQNLELKQELIVPETQETNNAQEENVINPQTLNIPASVVESAKSLQPTLMPQKSPQLKYQHLANSTGTLFSRVEHHKLMKENSWHDISFIQNNPETKVGNSVTQNQADLDAKQRAATMRQVLIKLDTLFKSDDFNKLTSLAKLVRKAKKSKKCMEVLEKFYENPSYATFIKNLKTYIDEYLQCQIWEKQHHKELRQNLAKLNAYRKLFIEKLDLIQIQEHIIPNLIIEEHESIIRKIEVIYKQRQKDRVQALKNLDLMKQALEKLFEKAHLYHELFFTYIDLILAMTEDYKRLERHEIADKFYLTTLDFFNAIYLFIPFNKDYFLIKQNAYAIAGYYQQALECAYLEQTFGEGEIKPTDVDTMSKDINSLYEKIAVYGTKEPIDPEVTQNLVPRL